MPSITPVATELASAASYALLAYSGITNVGSSLIAGGYIGSAPTATETGFPPGLFTAPAAVDNTHAAQAQIDLTAAVSYYGGLAYTSLSASSANLSVLGNGSSPSTYVAGNYSAGTSMDIPTSITLDAQGNPAAFFIFKAGSTITLESGASILLVNGAVPQNVLWIAGSTFVSVYNGTSSVIQGNIIAATSVTLGGGQLNGRALAQTGAVSIAAAVSLVVPAAQIPVSAPPAGPPLVPGVTGGPTKSCLISRNQGAYTSFFSVPYAWPQVNTSQLRDLVQILDQGGKVLVNVNFAGVVSYPAVNPTPEEAGGAPACRVGTFYTRLTVGATLAAIMADAFTNKEQLDIIQVINPGGAISYWWDYLGVGHGQ